MIDGDLLTRLSESSPTGTTATQSVYRRLSVLETLFEREVVSGSSVSLPRERRLSLWRHGFTSRSGVLFDVEEGRYDEYLSDYQLERLDSLGGPWGAVVKNKLAQYLLLDAFREHLPGLYGVLDGGDLKRRPAFASYEGSGPRRVDAVPWLRDRLDDEGALVLKPVYGYGGSGVYVCRRLDDEDDEDGYLVNGERKTEAEFSALVEELEEYLVWEFVEQADYAADLFPDAVHTLRVLTLWDPDADEPFVSKAVHRVGTADSAPVDNWSRGGLSAEIREDGTLGPAAYWSDDDHERRWFQRHPDTDARIEGAEVPGWPAIRDRLLELASAVPYLPRVGWDVVVTGEGEFVVLELNSHAGVETLQVHGPLLRDERSRRFYEYHGFA
ncbi:sugar-transfer associated ATP-grasp domain-containing protein [Halogeometricum luteum]|uniref:Alpha-L-glutamate ligase-related protein ATP-grasp domain-containing protein n=1 Tax=Halogeometricum luteum TaxID=2950537 RepID=A0ABU2FZ22_9EURY|nr:sugar-transfer associated ATP-grasp domain-containing protein [Halogeometricum sp. S3BR5-2]MDS0293765.1 hypothetical protein [Halogeometricum sp. S3BR5-2]